MSANKPNSVLKMIGAVLGVVAVVAMLWAVFEYHPPDVATDPNADPVVVVYRSDTQRGPGPPVVLAPAPIVCNDTKLADLGNHRAFAVQLPPGQHSFKVEGRSNWYSTDLTVKKGKIYYLVLYSGSFLRKGKHEWLGVALDFRYSRYGPETRLNTDLRATEFAAPGEVTLPMVSLVDASPDRER